MAVEVYKNVIVGSGEGGKVLAWTLAGAGEKTVVVDRRWIGGSCPNVNCLPSKNEIWSAKVAHLARHGASFGVKTGTVSVDMAAVRQRKREMVDGLIAVHVAKYKATGAELVMGAAKVVDAKTVEVTMNDGSGVRTFVGERLFLNLGTTAAIPPVPGLRECGPLTHIEALELDRLPEHLVVVGGGYVGLEFAQAYRRFGSRVTVVQSGPQLMGNEDADVAAEVMKFLAAEGVEILLSTALVKVEGKSGQRVVLTVKGTGGERVMEASDIFVATGRTPNTKEIGLDKAGVKLDAHGYIAVNERLEVAPGVWAIGECAGSPQFTHASLDDFRVIRDNLAGGKRSTRDRLMPSCLFTEPPVAHIGLTEREAKEKGVAVRVAQIPIAAVLRTRTLSETEGFMKALVDPVNNKILGFTMIGPEAGEVIAVVQMSMLAGFPFTVLRDAVLTHPTMAEGLNVLFSTLKGE